MNAIESANINANTMEAMKKGADALKAIHGSLWVHPLICHRAIPYGSDTNHCFSYRSIDKVDATMDSIREQMELTNEISDAISNPMNVGIENDEDELKAGLKSLIVVHHLG